MRHCLTCSCPADHFAFPFVAAKIPPNEIRLVSPHGVVRIVNLSPEEIAKLEEPTARLLEDRQQQSRQRMFGTIGEEWLTPRLRAFVSGG